MRLVKSAVELKELFTRGVYCGVRWKQFGPDWTADAPIVSVMDDLILVDHLEMSWWRINDPRFVIVTSAPEEAESK